jgi:PAS domain S-box-containing protein
MSNDHQKAIEPGHETQIRQAKSRTEQAEARTAQARTRTELAETRTEEAESRTELAKTRTEQAEIRTEQAEMRSEEAIRASEVGYRRLFEAAKEGILILEADTGQISDVNPFLIEMLGFSHDELVGTPIWELGPFKDIVSNKAKFEQLRHQGYVLSENLPLETKDGHKITVEFVTNVYQAGEKKVIQCNIRNITQAKKVEARFRRLVDSNAQGVFFWNTKGAITGANDAFLKIVQYTNEGTYIQSYTAGNRRN